MFQVINISLPSVSILITVGMIIGVWIASGTVATLIYYCLKILSPELFLAAGMVLCSIVSVSLGISWGTTGTVGLALMGIVAGFGIPIYWTAGAGVSGAFFGNKMSPLSDTTKLAPAVTGTNLFDHCQNMLPATVHSILIALVIYFVVGFTLIDTSQVSFDCIHAFTTVLDDAFWISPIMLFLAVLIIVLAVMKQPPIPTLFAGAMAGGIMAIFCRGAGLHETFAFANSGYSINTDVPEIDPLLNRCGIQSMSWIISLGLWALGFGRALERVGCLQAIIKVVILKVKSFADIRISAIMTSVTNDTVAGDPYLSIALPGRMCALVYRAMGFSSLNLSRTAGEGGTLMSPLIPWNAGGAYVITVLCMGIADRISKTCCASPSHLLAGCHWSSVSYMP